MEKDVVIKVEGLHKKFCRNLRRSMFYGVLDVMRDMFGIARDRGKLRKSEFFALEDINFELKKGEALGIIGQNGSGKTTLLRIINGIFPPDRGKISVCGRMGALIAVGAGFHPHMTGKENIYLNGTILGMSRKEIDEKLQKIIDFADIGEFIDAPVSTYSSGMTVRLGFSIAIHSNPDILIADEILAVGDLSFALKCYRKISEYREKGGSIILVSHGMQLIRNTCQKALWIDVGKVITYDQAQKVCDKYESEMMKKNAGNANDNGSIIKNDSTVGIKNVEFLNEKDEQSPYFEVGDKFKIRMFFDCERKVVKPIFTVSLFNPENIQVISNYTNFDNFPIDSIEGNGYIDFSIDKLSLKPSRYSCMITFTENNDINNVLEWHDKAYTFTVKSNKYMSYGLINPFPKWEIRNLD